VGRGRTAPRPFASCGGSTISDPWYPTRDGLGCHGRDDHDLRLASRAGLGGNKSPTHAPSFGARRRHKDLVTESCFTMPKQGLVLAWRDANLRLARSEAEAPIGWLVRKGAKLNKTLASTNVSLGTCTGSQLEVSGATTGADPRQSNPIVGISPEALGTGAAHVVLLRPVSPVADYSPEATYCASNELPQLLRCRNGRRVRAQLNSHTQSQTERLAPMVTVPRLD
jgi:hypothetical protein